MCSIGPAIFEAVGRCRSVPLNCCRAAGPQGPGSVEADALEQFWGHHQVLFDKAIMHFCAVWDDNSYVFVASTAPNVMGDEKAWTIRPAARSEKVTEGARPLGIGGRGSCELPCSLGRRVLSPVAPCE